MANKKSTDKKNVTKTKSTNRINSDKTKRIYKKKEKEEVLEKEEKVVKENKTNSSSSFNLIEVIIIMIITAVFGILIGTCVAYFKETVVDNNFGVPDELQELVGVYNEINSEYYSEINKEELIEAGIEGMVKYLNDPYSTYLNYDETQSLSEELEGEFVGMGATVSINDNNQIYVYDLFEDSPATRAGFLVGDIIIKVDGKDVKGMDTESVSILIKGEENTKVDITILRDGNEMTLELTRGRVVIPSVAYKILNDTKIGYINISVFANNTGSQFEKAMDDLLKQGAESVIIDVRGNSGGYLTTAEDIAAMFLDKNDVMYQLDTKGSIEKIKTGKKGKYRKVDVAMLVNAGSASASELLTGALMDNNGAKVVGEKTYGKGTVQKAKTLSSGTMIKYTIQEWYTPKGNKVNGVGIEPTNYVKLSDEFYSNPIEENDNQLEAAIDLLKK